MHGAFGKRDSSLRLPAAGRLGMTGAAPGVGRSKDRPLHRLVRVQLGVTRLEAGGGGGFGVESGDGFDEACDGEGVANPARAADEVETTTVAGKGDGEFHQRRNAGAIDLRNIVEIDDHFRGAALQEVLGEVIEMFAGLADGKPAVNLKVMDSGGFARRNFQRWVKHDEQSSRFDVDGCWPLRKAAAMAAPALYDEGYEEQVRVDKGASVEGVHGRGGRDPGKAAERVGRDRPAGNDADGGGTGRGVCVEGIAGAEEDEPVEPAGRSESGDWVRGGVPVSGDGRSGAGFCGGGAGVSVHSGAAEFSRGAGVAGSTEETEGTAGCVVLRRAGVCASAAVWAGMPCGRVGGPAYDWLREKHFDWGARTAKRAGGKLDGIGG